MLLIFKVSSYRYDIFLLDLLCFAVIRLPDDKNLNKNLSPKSTCDNFSQKVIPVARIA